jgi:hypothetical protein
MVSLDVGAGIVDVAENRRPAKFRIAATVAAARSCGKSEGALWAELDRAHTAAGAVERAIEHCGDRMVRGSEAAPGDPISEDLGE